ncbi:OsmC family protein [Aeromicrobium sp. CTD01-1L150]|uniref:OsmC family protein n=1 Tax=Aeromicrobium sp. CTD01-1L150 TaxID=3341830 RepID=UPI0035BF18BB
MDHEYALDIMWQGNRGTGTSGYRDYGRDVLLQASGKPDLLGSADPTFRGARDRWNPEELLIAALAQCHLLSYLHSAVRHGVVVTDYVDSPLGTMTQSGQGGSFSRVVLRPVVSIADAAVADVATAIHEEAGRNCFIAASVNFPVVHEPRTVVSG